MGPELHAHRAGPLDGGIPAFVEQTLPAFARTWATPGAVAELDVRLTADGVPVVAHDRTLERLTGDPRPVAAITLAGFRRLRATVLGADGRLMPAPVPVPLCTLADALHLARRAGGRVNVELKNLPGEPAFDPTSRFADAVLDVVRSSGVPEEHLTLQSFWEGNLGPVRDRLPGARRSLLARPDGAAQAPERARAAACHAVGLAWPAPPAVIAGAHALGLEVMAYTVNDQAAIAAAARAGVDVVITDDPPTARAALAGVESVTLGAG